MKVFGWTFGSAWLTHSVAVYVPSTRDVDTPLAEAEIKALVQRTGEFLTERFGGATAVVGTGYYVAKDGRLVTELVTRVYAFSSQVTTSDRLAVIEYAAQLRDEIGQESVSVEVDNKLRFI